MKISIPIDIWNPRRGGAERYLSLLSASLVDRGHEVTILCMEDRDPGSVSRASGPGTFRTVRIEVPRFPRWRRELLFARRTVDAHREAGGQILFAVRHALQADVYQPHGGCYRAATRGSIASLPLVARALRNAARWMRPTFHVFRYLDRRVFENSPELITISLSRFVEEGFERHLPRIAYCFERIHNGIPLDRFHDADRAERAAELRRRFEIPAGAPVALFLANAFRPKGLQHAIRALAEADNWRLIVGGRGRSRPFRRLAARLGVEHRVHFAGSIDDVRAVCAGADAFVLPTYYDPCSLSLLEALACGAPAVSTRQNGASELLRSGHSGFVLETPADVHGLARSLGEIDANRRRFHDAALECAKTCGWDEHVDRVEAVLRRRLARDSHRVS